MIHDRFTIRSLDDICYYLRKYRRVREDWRVDFSHPSSNMMSLLAEARDSSFHLQTHL